MGLTQPLEFVLTFGTPLLYLYVLACTSYIPIM